MELVWMGGGVTFWRNIVMAVVRILCVAEPLTVGITPSQSSQVTPGSDRISRAHVRHRPLGSILSNSRKAAAVPGAALPFTVILPYRVCALFAVALRWGSGFSNRQLRMALMTGSVFFAALS